MYTWGYLKQSALSKLDISLTDNSQAEDVTIQDLVSRFPTYANEVITQICSSIKPKYSFAHFLIGPQDVNVLKTMPEDFVSFGDAICYKTISKNSKVENYELHDTDYSYHGYNQIRFFEEGDYYISYNARWITFSNSFKESDKLDIPADILDCIPSYIASQCYKIDNEYKASVYRNEYELLLARIENSNYKNTKTFIIEGDW